MKIWVHGIRWEKRRIKQTQMKEKQCNLLFRASLCYFYTTFSFIICLKLLFNVFLVRARKYGGKQVSRTVLWVLWCTSAITYEFLGAQPKIQSHMQPVSCNLWAMQSVMLFQKEDVTWYDQKKMTIDVSKELQQKVKLPFSSNFK